MKPRPLNERDLCPVCDGSGEGVADGSKCERCGGSGIDSERDDDWPEDDYE